MHESINSGDFIKNVTLNIGDLGEKRYPCLWFQWTAVLAGKIFPTELGLFYKLELSFIEHLHEVFE